MRMSAPVSFGFIKKRDVRKLGVDTKLQEEATDYVLSVDEKTVKSTQPKVEKKELKIPLVLNHRLKIFDEKIANSAMTLEEKKAAREIIQESLDFKNHVKSGVKDELAPIYVENKITEGFRNKDKLDVSMWGDVSTLEDYENVPVEEFGMAMLKGMGWTLTEEEIENNKKQDIVVRPKGLGLGADPRLVQKIIEAQSDNENNGIVKGNYVLINQGSYAGSYGEIEGHDEDVARLLIKLAIGGKVVTVTHLSVTKVSPAEYKEKAKVINSEKYDKYKAKHEMQHKSESRSTDSRNKSSSKKRETEKYEQEKKRQRSLSDSSDEASSKSKHTKSSKRPWVRPLLRVRFIDRDYKQGRFFKKKLCIIDVSSIESCICKTEDGKLLEDIPQSFLETVIPRSNPAYVMVVSGKFTGELGEILSRDKGNCVATVQLLKDRHIIQTEYDSICEYVGDVTEDDNY